MNETENAPVQGLAWLDWFPDEIAADGYPTAADPEDIAPAPDPYPVF